MSDTNQLQPKLEDPRDENLKMAYQELCTSYRAIDDFRAKLLGLLPLVSGTGIFFLLSSTLNMKTNLVYLGPIGLFGSVVTLGLFLYELSCLQKCQYLIGHGEEIEYQLKIKKQGQFDRDFQSWKTFAACMIYSAVFAAWIFVALVPNQGFWWVAALFFFISFVGSYIYNRVLEKKALNTSLGSNKQGSSSHLRNR
jgi:hypothetical protein